MFSFFFSYPETLEHSVARARSIKYLFLFSVFRYTSEISLSVAGRTVTNGTPTVRLILVTLSIEKEKFIDKN